MLCLFFGVRPRSTYLLGVLWLPVVTCAQVAGSVSLVGVRALVIWSGLLYLRGVFVPLEVTCT